MIKSLNAQAISDALSRAGLSPAKLAEQLDVSREAVSKWLHGESIPKPDKLLRLGTVLGLKLEELAVTAAPAPVPIASSQRREAGMTRDVHFDNAHEAGELLREFVDYLPQAGLTRAAVVKESSSDYDCVPKVKASPKSGGLAPLIAEVRNLIQSARRTAGSVVDTLQVRTNFEIGRRIVEHEQKGEKRAGYGQELLKILSARLTEEFGTGFSRSNLEYMRKFFSHMAGPGSSNFPAGCWEIGSEHDYSAACRKIYETVYFELDALCLPPRNQRLERTKLLRDRSHPVRLVRARTQTPESFLSL
jgi:transcriptional regulator with XRE-family HTH domain